MKEDIEILEEYLNKQDRKFVSKDRFKFLQAIENIINDNKKLDRENQALFESTVCGDIELLVKTLQKLKAENEHLKEKTTRRKKEITSLITKQQKNKKTVHKLNSIRGEWKKFKRDIKRLEVERYKLLAEFYKTQNELDCLKDSYVKLQKENTELKQLNEQKNCKFIQEGDDMDNNYMCTGCGEVWCFEEYTPVEVDCNYCSKCGAKITEVIESLKEE